MNDPVLILSVGQALEVQDALRRQGLPLSFLKVATSGTWFSQLNEVMEGRAEVVPIHDESVTTLVPSATSDAFRVDYSIKGTYPHWLKQRLHPEFDRADTAEYHLGQVQSWLHPTQKSRRAIDGRELYRHIQDSGILLTCLSLRDLEEIQRLGIEVFRRYFRGKDVFAWKDVVRDDGGRLRVPSLGERGGHLFLLWFSLVSRLKIDDPALRFAS